MTQIVGTIEDSGGVGLTGILRVSLDSLMVDGSSTPDALLTGEPRDFAIANGVVNIDLVESQTKNLTYHIQFLTSTSSTSYYFANGGLYTGPTHYHTDSQWYTGAVHTTNSELLFPQVESRSTVLLDFHAVVPSINSVGFSALVPTGIATDILDTSLRRLAEILVTNVDYVETLRGGPRWKGDYNTATYYQQADTVAYAGSGWFYNNPNPAAGQTPSEANTAYWQLVSRKGDPGGTGGNDVVYNAIGWNGATWAPTANAVRDIIELLARANDAALTGNPTATTQATGNNSTRLATTAFVIAEILSRFNNANLLGIPTIGSTPLLTDNSSAIANTNFVKSVFHRYSRIIESQASGTAGGSAVAGIQTRNLNTIVNNAGDVVSLTNNRFTLRSGTYRIVASSPALSVNSHRIFLWNVAASTRTLNGKPTYSSGANAVSPALLQGIFTVVGNTDFEIRHYCQTAVVTSGGLGVSAGDGTNEIYTEVEIWRID